MGRFATTALLYEQYRTPYPAEFFCRVAERLKRSSAQALIDLGTGPALLALGFAPYVSRVVGVDPEPAMLAVAREAVARSAHNVILIEGKAEALPADIGRFDVVTIGRALHWMDRHAMPALFDRLLTPHGAVVVCASASAKDGRNPWLDVYKEARRAWSGAGGDGGRHHEALADAIRGSRFQIAEEIAVETTHEVGIGDLARRILTFSTSSPDILGDKTEAMLRDVETRLRPLSRDGRLTEVVMSTARIVR